MTGHERLYALIQATRYVVGNRIQGVICECGVWRGGAIAAAALTLQRLGVRRPLYLYDTFEGMSAPTIEDKTIVSGRLAIEQFEVKKNQAPTALTGVIHRWKKCGGI